MKYPTLTGQNSSRDFLEVFGGYNHNLKISEGEFYDMQNLTSSYFPLLSPRKARGVYKKLTKPNGLIAKDALCYVDGNKFYINEYEITGFLDSSIDEERQLISMGAYVIILPDKKYINTLDYADRGNIEAEAVITSATTFTLCKNDGTAYTTPTVDANAPSDTSLLWIDTSSTPHTLKQYNKTTDTWVAIGSTYIKISATGIGANFAVGDGITISNITIPALQDLNSTMVVQDRGEDFIVVIGILDFTETQNYDEESPITVSRKMPEMDFVIESGNRLWGCYYGIVDGKVVNEIYASKLGDFKNWYCYAGISTDSYAASCGTDGQWTGAITHLGYPIFFKENCLHKVYGNFPSNYQIQTTTCRGVEKGSHKSLAIVNEALYYKARNGICVYDGSLPVEVSAALGEVKYRNAVSGVFENKYYISMADSSGKYHLFAYDTVKGMWHKEDNTQVDCFCNVDGELYYIDHADGCIKTINGSGTLDTTPFEWIAETGTIGTSAIDNKYVSKLNVRMSLDVGTNIKFFIQYNSSGAWELLFTMLGTSLRSFTIPVRPKRCDHFRIKIIGTGEAKIYSISKILELGSDRV